MKNRPEILEYTGMNEQEMTDFIFENACEYLWQMYRISELSQLTPYFWKWWVNRWDNVDEEFLDSLSFDHLGRFVIISKDYRFPRRVTSEEQLVYFYKNLHSTTRNYTYLNQHTLQLTGVKKLINHKKLKQ